MMVENNVYVDERHTSQQIHQGLQFLMVVQYV